MDKSLFVFVSATGAIGLVAAYGVMIFVRFPCPETACLMNLPALSAFLLAAITSLIEIVAFAVSGIGSAIRRSKRTSNAIVAGYYGWKSFVVVVLVVTLTALVIPLQRLFFPPF